tara:strand:- start:716 stop:976 length:261 start_codon:yes stop_codon:yes gene_type:complete
MAVELKPKLDKMYIDIDGPNGNAFYLMAVARDFCKKLDLDEDEILADMKSDDYLNLLKVFEDNFGDFVVLQTRNSEYLDYLKSEKT